MRAERGFTLVEIFIALGLTSLVAVALLAAAHTQSSLQRQETQAQQTQDNVRAALEEMVTNARLAGTAFPLSSAQNAVPPNMPALVFSVMAVNNTLSDPMSDSPDALQLILHDDTVVAPLVDIVTSDAASLPVWGGNLFKNGDFVTLTNFSGAILYRLTGDPATETRAGSTIWRLPVTPAPAGTPGPTSSWSPVVKTRLISYQIDTSIFAGTPVLTLQDGAPLDLTQSGQIVAENIVDLQVAVGIDGLVGPADGRILENGTNAGDDEWIFNHAGETLPVPLPPGARIAAVRISVVGRSAQQGDVLGPGRPAVEDRPKGAPDRFRWRVLTGMVSLRNMASN